MIQMKEIKQHLDSALNDLHEENHTIDSALMPLVRELGQAKWKSDEDDWQEIVALCRSHSIFDMLFQDPFSRRAFEKPRGYSGDAELLDIIYNSEYQPFVPDVSAFGKRMFPFIINREMPSAVRERRRILTTQIDSVCAEMDNPDILSVACGHLREAQDAKSFLNKRAGRFVGLDQDGESLEVVDRELSPLGVETIKTSIKSLLKNNLGIGKFDFIYAAGLYDYLPDDFAHIFTFKLFQMLKPNGRLLVANFLSGIEDAGYVEIFMDWSLIYRDHDEVAGLAAHVPKYELADVNIFNDSNENIGYLEIRKI